MTLNLSRLTNRKALRDLYSAGLRSISANEEFQSRRFSSFLLLVRKHPTETRSLKANYYVQIVFRSVCVRIRIYFSARNISIGSRVVRQCYGK